MNDVTFFFGGWEPIARVLVVGTLAYLGMIILLRSSKKRTLAQMNAFDFIITVALGAAFGRILTARGVALTEAITAFALLIFLQFVMSYIQVRSPAFAKLATNAPTLLIYQGRILHEALRSQRVTEDELKSALRLNGVGSFEQVEAVILEPNGKFAVVKRESAGDGWALGNLLERENG